MTGLADDLLNLLRGHPLIEGVRVVEFDETPAGNLVFNRTVTLRDSWMKIEQKQG
jgi:hypothetical protein